MRIYYSHSLRMVGEEDERMQRLVLQRFPGAQIVNPARELDRSLPRQEIENTICQLIRSSDLVVVIEYKSHCGRGVWSEIDRALRLGVMVGVGREREGKLACKRIHHRPMVTNDQDWGVEWSTVRWDDEARTMEEALDALDAAGVKNLRGRIYREKISRIGMGVLRARLRSVADQFGDEPCAWWTTSRMVTNEFDTVHMEAG